MSLVIGRFAGPSILSKIKNIIKKATLPIDLGALTGGASKKIEDHTNFIWFKLGRMSKMLGWTLLLGKVLETSPKNDMIL